MISCRSRYPFLFLSYTENVPAQRPMRWGLPAIITPLMEASCQCTFDIAMAIEGDVTFPSLLGTHGIDLGHLFCELLEVDSCSTNGYRACRCSWYMVLCIGATCKRTHLRIVFCTCMCLSIILHCDVPCELKPPSLPLNPPGLSSRFSFLSIVLKRFFHGGMGQQSSLNLTWPLTYVRTLASLVSSMSSIFRNSP